MRTVHKQILQIEDKQIIEVPVGAKLLHVGLQNSQACIWYECETENMYESRTIYCFGTGHKMPEMDLNYIGTVIMLNGALVFHFYEKV